MENTDEIVENNNEELGNVDTPATETKVEEKAETKTFTQEELDEIVKTRLAKDRKKYPSKEELQAYNEWKESQKSAEQKQAEQLAEYQKKDELISNLEKQNAVLKLGVTDEDEIDYIIYKVSKMEGEFEDNLNEFITKNPRYINKADTEVKATGVPVKTINSTENDGVLAILKAKHPEMNI